MFSPVRSGVFSSLCFDSQASQLEEELASVRAQLAEARAGHDYVKPVEKAPKKKFFGRSKK